MGWKGENARLRANPTYFFKLCGFCRYNDSNLKLLDKWAKENSGQKTCIRLFRNVYLQTGSGSMNHRSNRFAKQWDSILTLRSRQGEVLPFPNDSRTPSRTVFELREHTASNKKLFINY